MVLVEVEISKEELEDYIEVYEGIKAAYSAKRQRSRLSAQEKERAKEFISFEIFCGKALSRSMNCLLKFMESGGDINVLPCKQLENSIKPSMN